MGFVAFDDPRLAGPVRSAAIGDIETTNAVAALRKALLGPEHGVLSALSLGFSVNVIGLRTSGGPVAFLNPRLIAASDFRLHEDETFVLTDIVRRQVIRPRRLIVAGQRETGEEASFTSEGTAAVQALQHLELIAGDGPLRWLSPTERLMLDPIVDTGLRQSIREFYLAVNTAVRDHRQNRGGVSVVSLPIQAAASDRLVAAASSAGAVDLHTRDPILPVTPANLLLFAFAMAPPRRQHALVVGSNALGAALSLKHVFPQLVLDLALPGDPLAEGPLSQLRLRRDERLRLQGPDLEAYEKLVGRNMVDAVLMDLTAMPGGAMAKTALDKEFRSLSRVTLGEGGLTIVASGRREPRVEAALKATFVHVDCWTVPDHGVVYLSGKRAIGRDLILGRICDLGLKIQNPALRAVLSATVTSLGKDGQDREAAP
ncbi:MAG: hypothetical protein ACRC14_03945 [Paracoccaceae bacterium]